MMTCSPAFVVSLVSALTMVAAPSTHAQDISITDGQIDRLKIELQDIRVAEREAIAVLPGTIVPPMNGRIAVAAPFAGTVLSVAVLPGQTVKAGDALMTIGSRGILEARSQLRQAEAELETKQVLAERYRGLADKKIAADNRAEEAEAEVRRSQAVVEEHRSILSLGKLLDLIREKVAIPGLAHWVEPVDSCGRLG